MEYRIKEIAAIKSGKRLPKGMDFSSEKTDYGYIRARDIKERKIKSDNLAYIDESIRKKIKKYIINKDDIAITIVGENIGDIGICSEELDNFNLTENAVRLTNYNKELVNPIYLSYYLNQNFMKEYMKLIGSGAAQGKLGIYKIEKIKVELPNIEKQKKVANILSQYDNLIENNSKRISLLEQIIENIYKEWFVRFRFPNHENCEKIDSKMGKIPINFSIKSMEEVLDYYIGGGWGNENTSDQYSEGSYVIRGTDFENASKIDISSIPYRYHKQSNIKTRILKENDLIIEISGGTQEQPVGRTIIITKELLESMKEKCICASFCKLIRCKKEISPLYFQYWMKYLYDTRIIERYQLQSTGIINFKFEYFLKKGFILIPPDIIMKEFEKIALPIQSEIGNLGIKNQILIKQRDLLLSRLMSGKLEVK